MRHKWVKVDNEFLSNSLVSTMLSGSGETSGKTPSTWRGTTVHSFCQHSERYMEICWVTHDPLWHEIEMGNCKIDCHWWL